MTLELKKYKDDFFNWSTEPYRLERVERITNETVYGKGCFSITIFDERFFLTKTFEYIKNADTDEYFVKNGEWVGDTKMDRG